MGVDLPPDVQLARAISRGMNEDDARRRMQHQMPREDRLRHADYVIDNRGGLQDAEREVELVLERLRADLQSMKPAVKKSPR